MTDPHAPRADNMPDLVKLNSAIPTVVSFNKSYWTAQVKQRAISHMTLPFFLLIVGINGISYAQESFASTRIPRPNSMHKTRALESKLAEWDHEMEIAARNCNRDIKEARQDPSAAAMYDLTYEVLMDNPHIFSVKVDLDVYCGGTHPDFSHGGVMFDPRTGQQLDPFQMFAIATRNENRYAFKPATKRLVRNAMLSKLDKELVAQKCDEVLNDEKFDEFSVKDAVLGTDGLHIMYPAAHVSLACYSEVVLTLDQLHSRLGKTKR